MPRFLKNWLARISTSQLAAWTGVLQSVIAALAEFIIAGIRLLDAIPFVNLLAPEKWIQKVKSLSTSIYGGLEKSKNWLLKLAG